MLSLLHLLPMQRFNAHMLPWEKDAKPSPNSAFITGELQDDQVDTRVLRGGSVSLDRALFLSPDRARSCVEDGASLSLVTLSASIGRLALVAQASPRFELL